MKVVALRAELKKRGLDSKGLKAVLEKRLKAAIEAENSAAEEKIQQPTDATKVATDAKEVATDAKEVATDAKEASTDAMEVVTDAKEVATDAKEVATDAKEAATDAKEASTDAKEPSTDAKAPSTDAKAPSTDAKEEATDAKEAATDAKAPSTDAKAPSTDAKEPSTDAKAPSTDANEEATDARDAATDAQKPAATDAKEPATDANKAEPTTDKDAESVSDIIMAGDDDLEAHEAKSNSAAETGTTSVSKPAGKEENKDGESDLKRLREAALRSATKRKLNAQSVSPSAKRTKTGAKTDADAPSSCTLRIDNFVRPFTQGSAKSLLESHGKIVDGGYWMDSIRTHCYVTYKTKQAAEAARKALDGLKWPEHSTKALAASIAHTTAMQVSADAIQARKDRNRSSPRANARPGALLPVAFQRLAVQRDADKLKVSNKRKGLSSSSAANDARKNTTMKTSSSLEARLSPRTMQVTATRQKPPKTLDDLFRKTKAKPYLYFLPLTDDQVGRKRQRAAAAAK